MELLILFLLGTFVIATTRLGELLRRRPLLQLAGCAVVAACYYSIRVIQ